jgi:hypothetical protein
MHVVRQNTIPEILSLAQQRHFTNHGTQRVLTQILP